MKRATDPVIRILRKCHVDENGCLIFGGFLNSNGYGQVYVSSSRRHAYTHRVMYERFIGPILDGLVIDHLCRTPACCNPAHLEAVTQRENILRGANPTAVAHLRDECTHGHSLADAHVRKDNGGRVCRTCRRLRMRVYAERRRAAA